MTALEARTQEHIHARHRLVSQLERLAQVAQVMADDVRDGAPVETSDQHRLQARAEAAYEAIAMTRATRP